MRVNIENCNNTGNKRDKNWLLDQLVRNLKEMRDRTEAGDMKAVAEFFDVFRFNDSQDRQNGGAA